MARPLSALTVFTLLISTAATVRAALPAGFQDTLIASVAAPTALAFTPDGRLLITTQTGQLRVVQNGTLLATSALNLSASICTNSERGLLGVAVDPGFASNRFVYLFYTFKKFGVCEQNTAKSPVNRVARFVLPASNVIDRTTEVVLVDNIPSPNGNHNAGDLHFGKDGFLYVTTGDGGCDYAGNSGCAGANNASRDPNVLAGKLLRITRDGRIPADNPFLGAGTARCNVNGRTTAGQRCQETYASGFRNPFRFAVDPNATATRIFINDVGQNTWEEINLLQRGADYGWNIREGNCANGSTTNCGTPPAGLTNPIFAYGHTSGCASITGGAFVPRGIWPAAYEGAYIFSDYVCGTIFTLTRAADGSFSRAPFVTGLGPNSAVSLIFGPFNGTRALYYTSYANGGQVHRIAFTGNRTPIATASASPLAGALPLSVRFDASGSRDPDGDALSFDWNFGDGTAHGTSAIATHTYTVARQFAPVVTVTDRRGARATATVHISAGNTPPAPTITSPTTSARFAVGDVVTLRGSATDLEQGTLPDSALSWTVLLHHNTHTHPFLSATRGNGITITAPAPEDLAATTTSFLEIRLTATDAAGARTTVTQRFNPRLVNITLATEPSGLRLGVNGTTVLGPRTVTSWQRYVLNVSARTESDSGAQAWLPMGWSDGGALAHAIVTPTSPTTYSARFAAATPLTTSADAFVRGGTFASTNFGTSPKLVLKFTSDPGFTRETFLKFDLRPVATIGTATLRLFGAIADARVVDIPVNVLGLGNSGWSETAVTWNTRPASSTPVLDITTIPDAIPRWHEWDVTSYVRSQKAAGRNVASLALRSNPSGPPTVAFNAREAGSNVPELLVAAESASTPGQDIVLYAGDRTRVAGAWRLVTDSTAAGALRVSNPNAGAAKLTAPLAAPANFVEWSFTAEARTPYRLWIRGRAAGDSFANDSVFVQFSGAIDSAGQPIYRIGSTTATAYVLENCRNCGVSGWGWQDNGYGAGVLGPTITFAVSGPQTIRIQTREDGLSIDQIVLSQSTYLTRAPGLTKNDTTIVPK
jgi:glucose/arabinose dehydrogenase